MVISGHLENQKRYLYWVVVHDTSILRISNCSKHTQRVLKMINPFKTVQNTEIFQWLYSRPRRGGEDKIYVDCLALFNFVIYSAFRVPDNLLRREWFNRHEMGIQGIIGLHETTDG